MAGTALTAASSLAFLLPTNYLWFVALQLLFGVARTLGWLASQAYAAATLDVGVSRRLMGRFRLFANLGQVVGPVLAGLSADALGLRMAFLMPAAYATAFLVLGYFLPRLPHASKTTQPRVPGSAAMKVLKAPEVPVALILSFAMLWISLIYQTYFPLFLAERGVSESRIGILLAAIGLIAAASGPLVSTSRDIGKDVRRLIASLACGALGLMCMPFVPALTGEILVSLLLGVGVGASLPLTLSVIGALAPPGFRGTVFGLRSMVNGVAASSSSMVLGWTSAWLGIGGGLLGGGGAVFVMLAVAIWQRNRGPSR